MKTTSRGGFFAVKGEAAGSGLAATGPVAEGAGALAQAVSAARTGTSSQVRRVRVMAGRGSAEPLKQGGLRSIRVRPPHGGRLTASVLILRNGKTLNLGASR